MSAIRENIKASVRLVQYDTLTAFWQTAKK